AAEDVDAAAACAPGSLVSVRLRLAAPESVTPFGAKFGCDPATARELVARAAGLGLRTGIAFHVGSQQLDPAAWEIGVAAAGRLVGELAGDGLVVDRLNIG